jgi:hypothetical protein
MFDYNQRVTTEEYRKGYERIKGMGCKDKPGKMKGSKKTKKTKKK